MRSLTEQTKRIIKGVVVLRVGFPLIDQMIMFTHIDRKSENKERRKEEDENLSTKKKKTLNV